MTELGEKISALNKSTASTEKKKCKGKKKHDPLQTGPNCIDSYTGTPTPEDLLANMKKHRRTVPDLPEPMGSGWDVDQCDGSTFPFQTHHLIPKKYLPTHPVCVWLTKEYTDDPDYQLEADTKYSTDHANNGYCLPFVSTTRQWKKARSEATKSKVAFDMMRKTKKQLHQGNHSKVDFDEEDEIEFEGYLESIKELLDRIYNAGLDHMDICEACKEDGKKKIQPLHRTVDQVDLVSTITKLRIDADEIFVSQRAYNFYKAEKE